MTGKAAIVGGGVIGGGWAARFLLMGWDVAVFDPDPEAARKIGEVIDGARRALPMLYDTALPAEGRLTMASAFSEAVEGADWVQESVPERLALKHTILQRMQATARDDAIIGSSTSGFMPTELQASTQRPGQVIVAHPFNPVYLLPLVEVVGSSANTPEMLDRAEDILRSIGMAPLRVRAEVPAHIADRLLESVWREALWLVKDGVATTEEIDDAIRMGFGLRWAQMGLFETYRIAGGEAGMRHFLGQFGPALEWPWSKLTDVPAMDDALIEKISQQSDAQAGAMSVRALERLRDDNLIAILRALRQRGAAAGKVLTDHEQSLKGASVTDWPLLTVRRIVPVDWTDYNGHMNEGRYGQVFSDAADAVLDLIGAGPAYVDAGHSFFTVETSVSYKAECHAGEAIAVRTQVRQAGGKKLGLYHEMWRGEDLAATCTQLLIHVDLETRKSCDPLPEVAEAMARLPRD